MWKTKLQFILLKVKVKILQDGLSMDLKRY